ncbi:MAG: Mur ligase family protein [bacterium]
MSSQNIKNYLKVLELYDLTPQFETILVTGTAGKSTTCHYLSLLLNKLAPNISIGLFSKPHIKTLNERFRINYKPIPQNLLEYYQNQVEKINSKYNLNLNWFDKLVAVAINYFIDQKVDLSIFEIGIGGLNDSTNALKSDLNIITNVSLEHTDILGKTIREIATQKAGIIKNQSIVITNATKGSKVIKQKCKETNSELLQLKDHIKIIPLGCKFPFYTYKLKILPLQTEQILSFNSYYLVENFSIALLAAIKYLESKKIPFKIDSLQSVIDNLQLPLKNQVLIYRDKTLLLDTAKDFLSLMKLFKHTLKHWSNFEVILAFSKGKEPRLITKLLEFLLQNGIRVYLSEHNIEPKKLPTEQVLTYFKKHFLKKNPEKNIELAFNNIIPLGPIKNIENLDQVLYRAKSDKILITGSLYFTSEIYNMVESELERQNEERLIIWNSRDT